MHARGATGRPSRRGDGAPHTARDAPQWVDARMAADGAARSAGCSRRCTMRVVVCCRCWSTHTAVLQRLTGIRAAAQRCRARAVVVKARTTHILRAASEAVKVGAWPLHAHACMSLTLHTRELAVTGALRA
eukprot:309410-Chlamydomonas_euryale.AAC.8